MGKRNKSYTKEDLDVAIDAVKNGMSEREAVDRFHVSRSTIGNRIRGDHGAQMGAPTLLSRTCETILATLLIFMCNIGFGLEKSEIFGGRVKIALTGFVPHVLLHVFLLTIHASNVTNKFFLNLKFDTSF